MKKRLFFNAFVLVALIFLFNALANMLYWYTAIYGFDKVMHFFGGVFLAFLVTALFSNLLNLPAQRLVLQITLLVLLIGFGWELFEYVVQFFIKGVHLADPIDSLGDLCFDTLGGFVGALFVILEKKRYNRANG